MYVNDSDNSSVLKLSGGVTTTVSSDAANAQMVGSMVYFSTADTNGYYKLNRYDGTTLTQISDTNATGDDSASNISEAGTDVYFFADTGAGVFLHRYHAGVTTVVPDIVGGSGSYAPVGTLGLSDGTVYFSHADGSYDYYLYYFDGTTTTLISGAPQNGMWNGWGLDSSTNTLYYIANDNSSVPKLYKAYNGVATELADIHSTGHEGVYGVMVAGAHVYATAWNNDGYKKIFYWNGSTLGQLSNTNTTGNDLVLANGSYAFQYGSDILFTAFDGESGERLYRANGNNLNSMPRFNFSEWINPVPTLVQALNDVYVITNSSDDAWFNLFRLDGTAIQHQFSVSNQNTLSDLQYIGDRFYTIYGPNAKVNTMQNNTFTQISDLNPGASDDAIAVGEFDSAFFFTATADHHLYRADGNVVTQVSNTSLGGDDAVNSAIVWNGDLYFVANDNSANANLYRLHNGTVSLVLDLAASGALSLYNGSPLTSGIYYVGMTSGNERKTFYFNGTTLVQLPETNSTGHDNPGQFAQFGSKVCYNSRDNSNHSKLFCYNGSTVDQISDTRPGGNDFLSEQLLVVVDGSIYFSARKAGAGSIYKLYRYDGNAVTQASDIRAGADDNPFDLITFDSKLYFSALASAGKYKLYRIESDYSVTQVFDIIPGGDDAVSDTRVLGGRLYFRAAHPDGGTRLYRY